MSDQLTYSIEAVFHPTDFSDASRVAFEHALRIALANRSSLDIVHADAEHPRQPIWRPYPHVRETLARWGFLEEDSPQEAVGEQLGVTVRKIQLDSADPSAGIAAFLGDRQSGLLVLSTEGREGLPRWLRPSVSEQIVRRALPNSASRHGMIAALFVPAGVDGFVASDTGAFDLTRVLVPVDRTPEPQPAIDVAGAFLSCLGCEPAWIEALYIGDKENTPRTFPPAGLEECFQRFTRSGNPVDQIIDSATRSRADLIVLSTAGRHGFLDALRGSTAEQVVRRAPCPVLAVPADPHNPYE